jgi:chlorobactene glucosyltransferase
MYQSIADIWYGFQKNFFTAFESNLAFWCFLLVHAFVFWLPFMAFPVSVLCRWNAAAWGAGVAAVLLSRALLALRFRQPLWTLLLHPVSESLLLALGVSSWWRCVSGKGVTWKGRAYRAGARVAAPRRL